MILKSSLETFGQYCLFIKKVLTIPDRWIIFFKRTSHEMTKLGVNSIPLVLIIAIFIGAVIAIQMQLNIMSPLIPAYAVGLCTRETVLLEFSSSILGLILAGKVGSNIVSEIGTMRVTEQIDALEIMGINSCNFLVLPKVVAFLIYMPILVIFCMVSSLYGGYLVSVFTDLFPASRYIYGIQSFFTEWYVWYGLIKSLFFSFVITTVAAFYGYYVKGGALQVGKASTNAVVTSSIIILLLDVALTNLLLQ